MTTKSKSVKFSKPSKFVTDDLINRLSTTIQLCQQVNTKQEVEQEVVDFEQEVRKFVMTHSWEDVYNKLNEEKIQVVTKSGTKSEKALDIYKQLWAKGKARKDIIKEFKSQLDMSDACASTYYQNIKKATGN